MAKTDIGPFIKHTALFHKSNVVLQPCLITLSYKERCQSAKVLDFGLFYLYCAQTIKILPHFSET